MRQIENHKNPKLLGLFVLLFVSALKLSAQSFENLNQLAGHKTNTYYSEGSREQAETMAKRCDSVIAFYNSLIDFEPTVNLLVLSPADWCKYTNFPVYGMPHYNDAQTLIVASHDNDFWKSFIPPLDQLPTELAQKISSTYTNKNNSLTMRGFFDLLAIHELGHVYLEQGGLTAQRKWMGELFPNIFLHTYIAEKEPKLLPALTVFPKMVVSSTNKEELKYTTLNDLESNFEVITQQYPNNYGWYQCRLHIAAGDIYDKAGIIAFKKLWQVLKSQKDQLDDSEFAKLLFKKVDQSVADVQLKWDE